MITKILGGVAILLIALIGLGFVLPDKVHVEREATIDAPPDAVFAMVSDFNQWEAWSPWAEADPDTQYEITGNGVGHKMVWRSEDPNVGNGSQVITALDAPVKIITRLEFEGMGSSSADFVFSPTDNGGTKVVWSFDTKMREGMPLYMQPMGTYMGFFMDGWVGKDYEKGLANLKREVENAG